jgi:soluble lytic murein transglycosylase-like protein
MSWLTAPNAAIYLPTLNAAELEWRIPTNLLARVAYQESSFRDDVVNGGECSRAGCKGLMQLNPIYFPRAGLSWQEDIDTAAGLLVSDYVRFQDWQLALASYNDGAGNVDMYVNHQRELPQETLNYVTAIVGDVPVPGVIVPGATNE